MADDLTRPIIGIENRTAQEVFDIMCDRLRRARAEPTAMQAAPFDGRSITVKSEDFTYNAQLATAITKSNGKVRYVVEDHGRLFIQRPEQTDLPFSSLVPTARTGKEPVARDPFTPAVERLMAERMKEIAWRYGKEEPDLEVYLSNANDLIADIRAIAHSEPTPPPTQPDSRGPVAYVAPGALSRLRSGTVDHAVIKATAVHHATQPLYTGPTPATHDWIEYAGPVARNEPDSRGLEEAAQVADARANEYQAQASNSIDYAESGPLYRALTGQANACRLVAQDIRALAQGKGGTAEGWMCVPREPTEAMLEAMHETSRILVAPDAREANILNGADIYRAMLAAAPTPDAIPGG